VVLLKDAENNRYLKSEEKEKERGEGEGERD